MNTIECSTVGLTLADEKRTLVGLQNRLVRAQMEESIATFSADARPPAAEDSWVIAGCIWNSSTMKAV